MNIYESNYELSCAQELYKEALDYYKEAEYSWYLAGKYILWQGMTYNPDMYMLEESKKDAMLAEAEMILDYAESLFT